jgi:hypothetical protein
VYDASYIKLREAAINYAFPKSFVDRLKYFKGIDIALSGRNLWIIDKDLPYADPEESMSAGNLQVTRLVRIQPQEWLPLI